MRRPLLAAAVLLLVVAAARAADDAVARAKTAIEKKQWNDALDRLQEATTKTPGSKEVAALATRVFAEGGVADAYVLAEDALNAAIQADAKDAQAHLLLGKLYLAKGNASAAGRSAGSSAASYFADAETQFRAALDGAGDDQEAAAGLVQTHHFRGAFDKALEAADAFLAKHAASPKVSFWKGQVLYLQGSDANAASAAARQAGDAAKADAEAARSKQLFGRAKGAYESSVQGDPSSYDGWIQLAYAAHWAGDPAGAQAAYEKSMDLAPTSEFPVKGLAGLLSADRTKYVAALERIAKEKPKYQPARLYLGYALLQDKRYPEAIKVLTAYVKDAENPGAAWSYIGQAHAGAGDAAKAREAFLAALKANPDDLVGADGLEQAPRQEFMSKRGNLGAAQELIQAYQPILKAAPRNYYVRNNLGLMLRDAAVAAGKRSGDLVEVDAKWLPILKESAKVYEEAAEIIGEWRPETATLPWQTRYDQAGIISDTGLMFWFHPQIRDVDKAQKYYERALEFSDGGYRDACINLVKLLVEKKETEQAFRVASDGADALKDRDGRPDQAGRDVAAAMAKQLEGK